MSLFKKYLSYIFPIKLESGIAQDEVPLHVYYDNGKIKLFTNNTNYSGGKLKSTFKKALKEIKVENKDKVLILGFGLGSVWEIIKRGKKKNPFIVGVDYEPLILHFIKRYFPHILSDVKTDVFITDAHKYLINCEQKYSLIIIDLFFDDQVSDIVLNHDFVYNLSTICNASTTIVLNTMNISKTQLSVYLNHFSIVDIKRLEKTNTIYYLRLANSSIY